MASIFNKIFGKKEESIEDKKEELKKLKLELAEKEIEKEIKLLLEDLKSKVEIKKNDIKLLNLNKELLSVSTKISKVSQDTSQLSEIIHTKIASSKKGKGIFSKISSLTKGLTKTRKSFLSKLDRVLLGKKELDEDVVENIEELLVTSDVGVKTTMELIEKIEDNISRGRLDDVSEVKALLRKEMVEILNKNHSMLDFNKKPFVILVIGVNGTGKTTTIGKLANKFKNDGRKVLLAAADTFRAAAIEQLEVWARRANIDLIKQKHGADPSAVAFDAVNAAKARDIDVLLIDTAGRLHTKVNLMEELKKMVRVIKKVDETAPHEILLVLDANTGQNAISQAKLFKDAINVTGLVLTKLDGTAKGGIVLAVSNEFNLPIRFIGVGEKIEDLKLFKPEEFINAIFD